MRVPFLDLTAQFAPIRDEIMAVVSRVFEEQAFVLGPELEAFEKEAATYCGVNHAVGVSSGSDAITVALLALGIGRGDAVVTSPYSFFATAGSIYHAGAQPVFTDIRPDTYNMDPEALARYVAEDCEHREEGLVDRRTGRRVRAVMPVHLYGQCADMEPILETARAHGLHVIEDAAQSIGAAYRGRKAGSFGDIACFSFFPTKNLGAAGDAGMATTGDPEVADKLALLRVHGMRPKHYFNLVGVNARLDAIQAAVLRVKLPYLEGWTSRRRANAGHYAALLGDTEGLRLPVTAEGCEHIYHQYVVRVEGPRERRDGLVTRLRERGIGCDTFYLKPIHLQEAFAYLGYEEGSLPEAEKAADQTVALPIYPELTPDMIDYVSAEIRAYLEGR